MLPDLLDDWWNGPRWFVWAFVAGTGLTAATIAFAVVAAMLIDGDLQALILLGLTIDLFSIGVVGSGMLEGLSSRAIAGGLGRQPLQDRRALAAKRSAVEQARHDRRTIRNGLIALPVLIGFVVLLYM